MGRLIGVVMVLMMVQSGVWAQKVRVAAAANLRYALEEIKRQYEKENPRAKIEITFGSSGTLTQQILNGAGFDLFLSADQEFPQKLKEKGATVGPIKIYAYGKLVLWSSTTSLASGLNSVLLPGVKKIAIANPVGAPYGEAAVNLLKKKGLYNKVEQKIVWGENIGQAAQFAFTGNAELGFIALSLAKAPEMKGVGSYCEFPETDCPRIAQACVLIKGWERSVLAAKFMNYLLGERCKGVWLEYGYGV